MFEIWIYGRSAPRIDRSPASADKIIGFGSDGSKVVLPAPDAPNTQPLTNAGSTALVLFNIMAIFGLLSCGWFFPVAGDEVNVS